RVLNDSALSAQAVLTREKHRHRSDITLHARGENFLHGVGSSDAWEPSVAQAIERITQQAQKVKGKWQERKRRGRAKELPAATPEAVPSPRPEASAGRRIATRMPPIMHALRQVLRPMSVSDATRELAADGDGVVVFRDLETAAISVLYRRRNGDLTLVQTEACRPAAR